MILVAAATAWVVAAAIGPAIFHDHLILGATAEPAVVRHAEEAFATASGVSLAVALLVALVTSVGMTIFLTRRIGRSLRRMRQAAARVAGGDYSARVPDPGMGAEFDDLAEAFNAMAAALSSVEATRTRMLGDLAHEMRTPVATVDAYLEGLQDGVVEADEATLEMLRGQVARLARLGEDISLVTSAEEGRLSMRRVPVSVGRIVDTAVAQASPRYTSKGVELEVAMPETAGRTVLDADVDRMGQVLTNLLDNALRHTPAGGTVQLTVQGASGRVRISVADTGEGIAPEHVPHVFERFYRADTARDRAHGGSGVGLAIVRSITHAHGGTATASSAGLGEGAMFTVDLPVTRGVRQDDPDA
ncbi:HAMP domain-containing sensor histidine kinase [Georgenia yuyongxinii]|uniref:HAMP domain-containing sensor histidine kinase n=1 Tax=Georgenia yuyongxinii TaxID=2589797 RepID=UPI001E627BBB|nr:ATP-binding protein [Georgenia yuyongxinii]